MAIVVAAPKATAAIIAIKAALAVKETQLDLFCALTIGPYSYSSLIT